MRGAHTAAVCVGLANGVAGTLWGVDAAAVAAVGGSIVLAVAATGALAFISASAVINTTDVDPITAAAGFTRPRTRRTAKDLILFLLSSCEAEFRETQAHEVTCAIVHLIYVPGHLSFDNLGRTMILVREKSARSR